MINAFSVDLEDWFCPFGSQQKRSSSDWNDYEIRIDYSTNLLLELLAKYNTKATFFVLSWIAERLPDLISKISENGHEIACHGYNHVALSQFTESEFNNDLTKSLKIITSITKKPVIGYRAPVFSITENTKWALDVLKANGIKYDSSIFPYKLHPEYGIRNSPYNIYLLNNGLIEVPLSIVKIMKLKIPCSGGAYFRLYPYSLSKYFINKINDSNRPYIFYIHPWELDKNQPRLKLNMVDGWRHYHDLDNVNIKIEKLLTDFQFTTISNLLSEILLGNR
jgi:polysaccharide deacetylase family protein (PEP-CTERM system associated)